MAERQARISTETQILKEAKQQFQEQTTVDGKEALEKIRQTCMILGQIVREAKDLKARQEFGLNKFLGLHNIN